MDRQSLFRVRYRGKELSAKGELSGSTKKGFRGKPDRLGEGAL